MTGLFKGILENETCLSTRMSPNTAFRVITNPLKPKEEELKTWIRNEERLKSYCFSSLLNM